MKTLQVHSQVGSDGVLNLRIVLGPKEAASRVLVTIQAETAETSDTDRTEWHRFVEETYGSCAGLGLERPEQLELEERDPIE